MSLYACQRRPALHVAGRGRLQGLAGEWGDFRLRVWAAGPRKGPSGGDCPTGGHLVLAGLLERSELVADLVGPEALEPNQGLVERLQVIGREAADLLQGLELALIEPVHHLAHLLPFVGEADPHRPAVGLRALMVDV